ncbi:hypothetical protein KSS87_002862 [Heliosperma pusillum]|nr:hypothetical protein KSS87_002862 [Heliosperma pusillum]
MAKSESKFEKVELEKSIVQEVAKTGKVPQEFLHEDELSKGMDVPEQWRDILLVDFSLLFSSLPAVADAELEKLCSALSNWGYFQVINHGMDNSFLQEVFEISKQFFNLPLEEKIKYSSSDEKVQGYAANMGRSRSQTNYWSDRLFLNLQPEDNRKLKFWPDKPANFSKIVDEYSKKLATFSKAIYKAMARSLKLEENCFINNQGQNMAISGGINFYPSCPSPDRVLGVKAHSDGSTMTILLPDPQVGGLQVLKDDVWYNVPLIPGALLVNLGDLGEVMTNGIFKSVIHRVLTNSEKDRLSVAAFFTSEDKKEITPVSELINEQHPQLYRKLDSIEFRSIFFAALSQGRKTLDALKV